MLPPDQSRRPNLAITEERRCCGPSWAIRFSASARPLTVRGAVNLERFSHREPSSSMKKRKLGGRHRRLAQNTQPTLFQIDVCNGWEADETIIG
jgi:hypothetical protein